MPKNVVIFSDGTGQVGGISFDENRSNIYKMYRASRVGPDSRIDPNAQMAFYDPGLGSVADGGNLYGRFFRRIYNMVSQATGLGITANIVDCYAALIRLWQPGDRIFLFGYSRGAYTVRCLASVIALCGIPRAEGSEKLRLDMDSSQRVARRAVKSVYQYTNSVRPDRATERQKELMEQRLVLAKQFRANFQSSDKADPDKANVYPHFIGAFDTVSAIATPTAITLLVIACVALTAGFAGAVRLIPWLLPSLASFPLITWLLSLPYLVLFLGTVGISAAVTMLVFFLKSIVWATGLPGHPWYRTIHFVQIKQKFMDLDLNEHVGYARQAISIDENRAEFARVRWGFRDRKHAARDSSGNYWFHQLWFAGNHGDIGGGFPENESRLSDFALSWMVDEARKVGFLIDDSVLRSYPSAHGMQHDEVAAGLGLFTRLTGLSWKVGLREIPSPRTKVHSSVAARFVAGDVQQYDIRKPYRPETLRTHDDFKKYYPAGEAAGPMTARIKEDKSVPPPTREEPD